jgi:hypothetical protein
VRVAIVSECFLPVVNGVTNSVRRIVEHLGASGHDVLIVAPGDGQAERAGVPVVRLPALELPVVTSIPVGVPRGCTPGARGVDAARFTPRKRCAALRDAVRRLLDPGGARPLRRDGAPIGPAPHLVDGRRRTDRALRRRARWIPRE